MIDKKKSPNNRRMMFAGIAFVALLVLAVVIWMTLFSEPEYTFHGKAYDTLEFANDFTLTDQNNNLVSLSDYRGKVVMLYFGFTHCPEACPITFGIWNQVSNKLGENIEQVQFLFVTVDPQRDTPEVIAKHLSLFTADITGLTGTLEDIEDLASDYSVFMEHVETEGTEYYLVNHTTLTFVINQEGQLVEAFPYATPADDIVADLQYLIEQ